MTALVSLLFIAMIPNDCKITNFSLRLLCIRIMKALLQIVTPKFTLCNLRRQYWLGIAKPKMSSALILRPIYYDILIFFFILQNFLLTGWMTDQLTNGLAGRPASQLTERPTLWLTDRPTDGPSDWPTDQPIDRLTDWPTNWPTDRLTN